MPPAEVWRAALEQLEDARVVLVIGPSDAGKTTLVAALARALTGRGARVGIVDADVGQSEIGPPTTVGLGRVAASLERPSDAVLVGLQFVGVSSPARDIAGVVEATRRMTARARDEGFDRVLIDTSGLVSGWPGRLLKQRKIEAVDPDIVLALERADECEPILARYGAVARPRVVRLLAPGRPRSRSQIARRGHRAAALDRYLAGATVLSLDATRVTVTPPRGVPREACLGALCGLQDAAGMTVALGVVNEIDGARIQVRAPAVAVAAIAEVRVGRERADGALAASVPAARASVRRGDGRDGAP